MEEKQKRFEVKEIEKEVKQLWKKISNYLIANQQQR